MLKYQPERLASRIEGARNKGMNFDFKRQLFTQVYIETISLCNSACSFCPVSTTNNTRPLTYMEDRIFEKIVQNLVDLNFKGDIRPYDNNEPLLDKNIFERISYIKERLGDNVVINMETNGNLLTLQKVYKLFENGIDQLCINDYAANWAEYVFQNNNIRDILKKIDIGRVGRKVKLVICHRLKKQLLSDRSGKVTGRTMSLTEKYKFCDFPFLQMNINPKGDVFICCRDSYWDAIMGNIENNQLEEIWFGEKYTAVRRAFLDNKRVLAVCEKCKSNGTITL